MADERFATSSPNASSRAAWHVARAVPPAPATSATVRRRAGSSRHVRGWRRAVARRAVVACGEPARNEPPDCEPVGVLAVVRAVRRDDGGVDRAHVHLGGGVHARAGAASARRAEENAAVERELAAPPAAAEIATQVITWSHPVLWKRESASVGAQG